MSLMDDLMADRPPVWEQENGIWVYRASALGSCIGALVRARLGVTGELPPDWLQERYDLGHAAEPETLRWIQTQGWKVWDEWDLENKALEHGPVVEGQLEVDIPVGTTAIIRAHLDGMGNRHLTPEGEISGTFTLEAKRLSGNTAQGYLDKMEAGTVAGCEFYAHQASVIHHATGGLPMVWAVAIADPESLEVVDHKLIILTKAAIPLGKLKAKVMKVERMAASRDLPPCDMKQWPCPYYPEHDEESKDSIWFDKKGDAVEVTDQHIKEFDELASAYNHAKTREAAAKKNKEAAGKAMAKLWDKMKLEPKGVAESGEWIVEDVRYDKKGNMQYDKLKTDWDLTDADLDKYRKKGSEVRYPKVTKKEDD